ncbi:MAG: hypothetical protein Q7T05_07090 [Dehalococcoidia bacterium]|nr:hypothetical protein [Dehalococcoidia bacterium]
MTYPISSWRAGEDAEQCATGSVTTFFPIHHSGISSRIFASQLKILCTHRRLDAGQPATAAPSAPARMTVGIADPNRWARLQARTSGSLLLFGIGWLLRFAAIVARSLLHSAHDERLVAFSAVNNVGAILPRIVVSVLAPRTDHFGATVR